MRRDFKLERYVKRYTNIKVKVFLLKYVKGGYGAIMNPFTRELKILYDLKDFKPLIWHEMGHLMTNDYNWIKREYKVQKWALKTLKRLKYNKIYKESLEWIKTWHDIKNNSRLKYGKVQKMLLKENIK